MKILISALSGIGDALMFSPALKLLRQKYPEAQIDLLSMFKGVEQLYAGNPDLDNVIHWDFINSNPFSSIGFLLKLRRLKYDVTINVYPSNRWPYNLISFLIGANKRLGHDYNHLNLQSLNFLNNYRILEDDLKHNVEENIHLIELLDVKVNGELPPLRVCLSEADIKAAEEWMKSNNIDERKLFIGFHAGSATMKNHEKRRWSAEKFAELGKQLIEKYGATILLFGGPDEYNLNDSINKMMDGKAFIVKVPRLSTSAALMSRCKVFVVNDSGLMHLAAGVQLPVVTIFAYTNPNYVYPWKTKYTMIRRELECSPCFYYSPKPASCKWTADKFRCITNICVDEVFSAVKNMLEE
jgi:lipopolysaccharide heptosyltransferase II